MEKNDGWQSRAGRLFCVSVALLGVYLALKYALGVLLPFLSAWLIGILLSALARRSAKRLGGKKKSWAVFYSAVFWLMAFAICYLAVDKLLREARDMLALIEEREEDITRWISGVVNDLTALPSKVPFLSVIGGAGERVSAFVSNGLQRIAEKGGEAFATGVGRAVLGAPGVALGFIVCIISSVYIAVDWENMREYLFGLAPEGWRIRDIFKRLGSGLKGYGRAYFWLFVITFTELYVGLLLLGRKYAFFISFVVAIFDMLPLFSAGVVLVVWGIVLIVSRGYLVGVGMLLLFGVITVTRQIVEPRLIGKQLGIHPLATLVAMYIGFRLFGFWGMILSPVGILALKEILEGSKKEKIRERT